MVLYKRETTTGLTTTQPVNMWVMLLALVLLQFLGDVKAQPDGKPQPLIELNVIAPVYMYYYGWLYHFVKYLILINMLIQENMAKRHGVIV